MVLKSTVHNFPAKNLAVAANELQRFACFHTAYHGRSNAYDGIVGSGHLQCCGFVGKQIPVCLGPITVTEYGDLPFKALDGAVHIRFVQCAATVANQITGGEVVASVYNDVIIGNQTAGILPVEAKRVGRSLLYYRSKPAIFGRHSVP